MRNEKLSWIMISLIMWLTSGCGILPIGETLFHAQMSQMTPMTLGSYPSPNPSSIARIKNIGNFPCGTANREKCYSIIEKWLEGAIAQEVESTDLEWIHQIMTWAEDIGASDPQNAEMARRLWSKAAYIMDVIVGAHYLMRDEIPSWQVRSMDGKLLTNPIDFVLSDKFFYVLDSGTIFQGYLPPNISLGATLTVTAILTPQSEIDGYLVQEIAAIAVEKNDERIVALDKSNDIYQYDVTSHVWHLLSTDSVNANSSVPQYVDIELGHDGLYILDVAGSQIWFQGWTGGGESVTARQSVWADLSFVEGVRLTEHNGAIFVLLSNGQIWLMDNKSTATLTMSEASEKSHVVGPKLTPISPVNLSLGNNDDTIFVADRETLRIIAFNRSSRSEIGQLMVTEWIDFKHLQGIQAQDGWLYLMVKGMLLRFTEPTRSSIEAPDFHGVLQTWVNTTEESLNSYRNVRPNEPKLIASLKSMSFAMPIAGAKLPTRMSLYPGARRSYRYGVHQGLDFFSEDSNVPITIGTPVRAVADGIVKRADIKYRELSNEELAGLLKESEELHRTPAVTLEKLKGRQLWIDHGNGVWTIYSHLDSIYSGVDVGKQVKKGDVIGFVGLTGTPDGISGLTSGAHLHFEIWIGDWPKYYLGQWLTINETRQIFAAMFAESTALATAHDIYLTELTRGPKWDDFQPLDPHNADHYWLELPFSTVYNQRYSPRYPFGSNAGGLYRPHHGIDISNPTGTPVLAVANGKVVHAGADNPDLLGLFNDFYGNSVVIQLDRRISTDGGELDVYVLFGHLDHVSVELGQHVDSGDIVGTVGMTGIALGPHLHVEVRVGENKYENAVNPDLWIRPVAGTGTLAVRLIAANGQSWDGATLELYQSTIKGKHLIYSFETYRGEDILSGDPAWGENGISSNLHAGVYYIFADINGEEVEHKINIEAGQTTFLEIRTKQ